MSWAEDEGIDAWDVSNDDELKQSFIINLDHNLAIWTDKQGKIYNIVDMKTDHIANCIKFMEDEDLTESLKYWVLKTEWNNRQIKQLLKERNK